MSDLMAAEGAVLVLGGGFDLTEGEGFVSFVSTAGEGRGNWERCSDDRLSFMSKVGLEALLNLGEEVVGGVETLDSELGALCRTLPGCLEMFGIVCGISQVQKIAEPCVYVRCLFLARLYLLRSARRLCGGWHKLVEGLSVGVGLGGCVAFRQSFAVGSHRDPHVLVCMPRGFCFFDHADFLGSGPVVEGVWRDWLLMARVIEDDGGVCKGSKEAMGVCVLAVILLLTAPWLLVP